jgi:hypothetical protein
MPSSDSSETNVCRRSPRRPVPAEPDSLANVLEHLPDVPGTQRCTGGRGEYPGVLPMRSGSLPLSHLVGLPLPHRPTAICASFSARRDLRVFPRQGACTGGSRLWLPGLRLAFQKGHLTAKTWWAQVGSNHRLLACKASALPLSYAPGVPGRRGGAPGTQSAYRFRRLRHSGTGRLARHRAGTASREVTATSQATSSNRGAPSSSGTRAPLAAKLMAWYHPQSMSSSSSWGSLNSADRRCHPSRSPSACS